MEVGVKFSEVEGFAADLQQQSERPFSSKMTERGVSPTANFSESERFAAGFRQPNEGFNAKMMERGGGGGVGIRTIHTEESTEDGGANVITIVMTNGAEYSFTVRNGSGASLDVDQLIESIALTDEELAELLGGE